MTRSPVQLRLRALVLLLIFVRDEFEDLTADFAR
jgi:hypothetical protein